MDSALLTAAPREQGLETEMTKTEIFESFVEILHNEAPSEKARAFVEKLAAESRQQGVESIVEKLRISELEINDEAIAPIEDNRLFWMGRWQEALGRV